MRKTYIAAGAIAALTLLWFGSSYLGGGEAATKPASLAVLRDQAAAAGDDLAPAPVRGRIIHAAVLPERVAVSGRTENKRTVSVRAETSGRVVERPVERGDRLAAGDLLCRLAIEDREARKTQAKAATNQARIEYQGSLRLQQAGHQSEAAIATALANLATAQAQLQAALLDIQRTEVRAPFAGMLEEAPLEVGDYAQPGGVCATIVDLDPMLLVGQVSERDVLRFGVGSQATGKLASGQTVSGPVSFIGQQADAGTRTYRVEVTVPNADYALRSGVTTEIAINVGEMAAHKVSPALLTLDDAGTIGVRIVGDGDRVAFAAVEVVADDADGVWVSGLPPVVTLITVGHQYVVAGQQVAVQLEGVGGTLDTPIAAAAPSAEDAVGEREGVPLASKDPAPEGADGGEDKGDVAAEAGDAPSAVVAS